MFSHSRHSAQRAAQRNISEAEIDYIVQFGQCFHRSGAVIYFLRCVDIPADDQADDEITRLAGTALVFSRDEKTLLTVWRNRRKGLKLIRRKPEYAFAKSMIE